MFALKLVSFIASNQALRDCLGAELEVGRTSPSSSVFEAYGHANRMFANKTLLVITNRHTGRISQPDETTVRTPS